MEEVSNVKHFQAVFLTKQERFSVPNNQFSVPGDSTSAKLSHLINALLKNSAVEDEWVEAEFDFIVKGELLRLSLDQHLSEKGITGEEVVEVEYFEKSQPPSPYDSLPHDDWVAAIHASEDGILTGCYDNTLHIWTFDGYHKLLIPGHVGPVRDVAWVQLGDPLSTFVSTSHDETTMLWQWNKNTNSIDSVRVCRGHARSVDCVDVSLDKSRFATGSHDKMLKIWTTDLNSDIADQESDEGMRKKMKTEDGRSITKTPLMTLSGHNEAVTGVQWIENSGVCTCSMDNTLKIWDVELGGLKSQLAGSKAFLSISYSNLNRNIISGSTDRHVRLWDPRSKEGAVVKSAFTSHSGWVSSVHWSPESENLFVSGSYDNLMKLWDTRSPRAPLYDLSGHEDKILSVDWSLPQYMLSGGADNQLKIFVKKV